MSVGASVSPPICLVRRRWSIAAVRPSRLLSSSPMCCTRGIPSHLILLPLSNSTNRLCATIISSFAHHFCAMAWRKSMRTDLKQLFRNRVSPRRGTETATGILPLLLPPKKRKMALFNLRQRNHERRMNRFVTLSSAPWTAYVCYPIPTNGGPTNSATVITCASTTREKSLIPNRVSRLSRWRLNIGWASTMPIGWRALSERRKSITWSMSLNWTRRRRVLPRCKQTV
mmetsp:Transcript_26628/g.44437  ORF Transcript_26628/g.44437 Transcript_26628/m.44437 type:complete len:228 (+) Transcript_26628:68-751(+)